jgi:hypothetical protein
MGDQRTKGEAERGSETEAQPDDVGRRLRDLEARLAAVESRLDALVELGAIDGSRARRVATGAPETDAGGRTGRRRAGESWTVGLPALVGRTIMVLGGAFLLRALTENGTMPPAAGVAAGLVYALAWTYLADRAAAAGRVLDATLHGLATTLIAFPLIWETSTRLDVMSPPVSAVVLTVVAAVILLVAWRRSLEPLAWLVTLAATAAGVVLLFQTRSLPVFAVALFVLAAASLAASFHRHWYGLRWPAALALDVLVVMAMSLVGKPNQDWLVPHEVAAVQLAMTAMYLGIIGVRTLVLGHPMREFGLIQSLAVLAVGFEGARYTLGASVAAASAFPATALVAAVLCYAVSFFYLEPRVRDRPESGSAANLDWYVTLGTILTIDGLRLALRSPLAALVWAAMAVVGAWLGTSAMRKALRWNTAALAVAAAAGSGLLQAAAAAFRSADPERWLTFPPYGWVTCGACLAAWILARWVAGERTDGRDRTLPGLVLLAVAAVGLGAAVVTLLAPAVASTGAVGADVGALAVLRTAVLVVASLVLAAASRLRRRPELIWVAYAVLVLTGIKIAVEDLPHGRAMTMFLSFVIFGAALIATPRLVPEVESAEAGEDGGPSSA